MFLIGVVLFGLGNFSRTFLVLWATMGLGENAMPTAGVLPVAVLLHAMHNAVSALAAYPAGHLGDRGSKLSILVVGYCLEMGRPAIGFGFATAVGSLGLEWLLAFVRLRKLPLHA